MWMICSRVGGMNFCIWTLANDVQIVLLLSDCASVEDLCCCYRLTGLCVFLDENRSHSTAFRYPQEAWGWWCKKHLLRVSSRVGVVNADHRNLWTPFLANRNILNIIFSCQSSLRKCSGQLKIVTMSFLPVKCFRSCIFLRNSLFVL